MNEVDHVLNLYIRPQTFPLAVRLCQDEAEVPEKVRYPLRDLGFQIPICQGFGIARRYGWALAIGKEDQSCPFGALALGFLLPKEGYLDGTFAEAVGLRSREGAARSAASMPRLAHGQY
ncbi:MAG: DUF169 domain-containing protein, partial [Chloroflexota bacterium]|nr:DUF169 domain-containing protein [Chloroflexota bacterium]